MIRRSFWRRDDGALAIEFMLLVPLFLTVFISSIETSILLTRQVMLERGLDMAVRGLRLNTGVAVDAEDIEDKICENAFFIGDCRSALRLELRPVDDDDWELLGREATCVDRTAVVQPAVEFRPGNENEMMLVRACAIYDPLFPTTGLGLRMPKVDGAYRLVAKSIFVHEPNS